MARTTATEFATIARALQHECARLGLVCPAFRAPPRTDGARSITRYPNGVVVRVRLDRDPRDVTADLIDGVVAAQGNLDRDAVELFRDALWEAAGLAVAA